MSTRSQVVRLKRSAAAFLLGVLATVSGCGFLFGDQERSWSEDVELDDGSVITIQRYVKFEESNSWSGDAYNATETRATLAFTGKLASLPTWEVALMPLVLYRDTATSEWVLVAKTSSCDVWDARGQPFPPYWEYRLDGNVWRERPLSSNSKGRATNLFINYTAEKVNRHIDIQLKKRLMGSPTQDDTYSRVNPDTTRYCMVSAK